MDGGQDDASTDATQGGDSSIVDSGVDGTVDEDGSVVDEDGGEEDGGMMPDASVTPVTPSSVGAVVITEFQAAPLGYADDALAEWVEVYNPSDTVTYDLAGCIFSDKPADDDFTIPTLIIGPGEYRVLASAIFTVALNGFVADVTYGTGTGLSGTADAPTIKCSGMIIDTVAYSAGGGFPIPDEHEGHAIQLDVAHHSSVDNDMGAHWCPATHQFMFDIPETEGLVEDNFGTPRAANDACP